MLLLLEINPSFLLIFSRLPITYKVYIIIVLYIPPAFSHVSELGKTLTGTVTDHFIKMTAG